MLNKEESLCHAARDNNTKKIEEFLNEGISIEAKDDKEGRTPLLWALHSGSQDAITLLLEKGADVKARSKGGRGALHELLSGSDSDCQMVLSNITLLIDRGVYVNGKTEEDSTPLHYCISSIYAHDYASLLIEKGADVNAKTKKGLTPLHVAINDSDRSSSIITRLINKGADVNACDNEGCTPLHYYAAIFNPPKQSVAYLLVDKGIDIDAKDKSGSTPLHSAVLHNFLERVTLLRNLGADLTVRDNKGRTPLDLANETRLEFCKALLPRKPLLPSTDVPSYSKVSTKAPSQERRSQGASASSRPIATTAPSQGSGSGGQSANASSILAPATNQGSGNQTCGMSLGSLVDQVMTKQFQQIDTFKKSQLAQAQEIASLKQSLAGQSQQIALLNRTVANQSQQIALLKESLSEQSREIALLKQSLPKQPQQIAPLPRVRSESMTTELTVAPPPAKRRRRDPLPLVSTTNENERRTNPMTSAVRQPRLLEIEPNMLFSRRSILPPEAEVTSSRGERVGVPPSLSTAGERPSPGANLDPGKEVMLQGTGDASFMGVNRLLRAAHLQRVKTEPFVSDTEILSPQDPKSPRTLS